MKLMDYVEKGYCMRVITPLRYNVHTVTITLLKALLISSLEERGKKSKS
ncbi:MULTISPECIES: hypothetical protein [Paenibacillus]|uniref:Uncharacterized protein n=2 Tax=Paenibacillus TaxID=44249 RepID=A0AAP3ZZF2_PAEPO|nr:MULTISPECIES: hypothetical protein [Paenibacillus]MBJ8192704.1 hypothetical protein [Bacillus cereus]MCP3743626.1 hypothetical protein [Paenibacillus sp. A3M_27_13]MDH2332333.1 hypothetical protein [Paenibacillus polymyxa]MDR6776867.1 hypothetical protein [Paenibacillus peoriae]